MMLIWMAYATLAGALLAAAGAVLECFSPWLAGRRRLLWLGVICATLMFAAVAAVSPQRPRDATAMEPPSSLSSAQSESSPLVRVTERGAHAPGPEANGTRRSAPGNGVDGAVIGFDALLLLLWIAATSLCLAVLTISAWRVAAMRRTWRESVLAGVPVFVSHDVGPAVIGLVHHGIVVPAWVETLGADDQRTVMTHEREHVRAGDPLLLWGATLLVAITPWNAALWYALRRLRHGIEIDCDARVLRSRPDARAYCTLLVNVGERTLAGVAPVAALAEPATLLERRIEAMIEPMRMRRRVVVGAATAALALVAAACFTPRPEVEPHVRVAQLVSELSALLSRDSVHRSLSPVDSQGISRALLAAIERSRANVDSASGSTSSSASESDRESHEYGAMVVKLAHDSFPEALEQRGDAIVVLMVRDAGGRVTRNYVRHFAVDQVFDVLPEPKDSIVGPRDAMYIASRMVPGWRPHPAQSGRQWTSEFPHALYLWVVLTPGEEPPPPQTRQERGAGLVGRPVSAENVIGVRTADSAARRLYPSAYATHPGILVVGLIFSGDGRVLRHAMRQAAHDDVFIPAHDSTPVRGEEARSGEELLSLVFTGVPSSAGRWSAIAHRSAAGPALVWKILPDDEHLPAARTDSAKVGLVGHTMSAAHRQVQVTLSAIEFQGRRVSVYSTGTNMVEAGDVGGVSSPIQVGLPATMRFDLGPAGAVHFESEDGRPFTVSAVIGVTHRMTATGSHISLDGSSGTEITVVPTPPRGNTRNGFNAPKTP